MRAAGWMVQALLWSDKRSQHCSWAGPDRGWSGSGPCRVSRASSDGAVVGQGAVMRTVGGRIMRSPKGVPSGPVAGSQRCSPGGCRLIVRW